MGVFDCTSIPSVVQRTGKNEEVESMYGENNDLFFDEVQHERFSRYLNVSPD